MVIVIIFDKKLKLNLLNYKWVKHAQLAARQQLLKKREKY